MPLRLTHVCTCGDVRTSMPNRPNLDDCSTAVPPVFGMCRKLWPGGRRKHPGATQLALRCNDLLWPSSLTGLIAAFAGPLWVAVRVSVIFGRMTRALTSREASARLISSDRREREPRQKTPKARARVHTEELRGAGARDEHPAVVVAAPVRDALLGDADVLVHAREQVRRRRAPR